jgi:hypothetical protein
LGGVERAMRGHYESMKQAVSIAFDINEPKTNITIRAWLNKEHRSELEIHGEEAIFPGDSQKV